MPTKSADPSSARVLLGADVGGSHTTVAVGRPPGGIVGRAQGPGAAMRPGGGTRSAVIIAETTRRAAAAAGVTLPADAMVVGAAGAGREAERVELARALERAGVAAAVRIVMDVEVALRAAFGRGPGILLNAGTGSIAVAHDSQGVLRRAGGYGWQLGDEGGGYWLARRALAAVGRAQDGRGDAGGLPQRLLGALGLATFDDLVAWCAIATPAQLAQLATEVLAAARDGDPAAGALLAQSARELAALIHALERWFAANTEVPVVLAGGMLAPSAPLRALVRDAVALLMPRAQFREGDLDPVAGAVELAAEMP